MLTDKSFFQGDGEFLVAARYRQQVWELDIPIAGNRLESEADVKALEQTFHETHKPHPPGPSHVESPR